MTPRSRPTGAEQTAARIAGGGVPFANLLVAAVQAGVEHDQIEQIAKREAAKEAQPGVVVRQFTNRHPLRVRAARGRFARRPVAFAQLRIVVLRAAGPGIVGAFVIVPDGDPTTVKSRCGSAMISP